MADTLRWLDRRRFVLAAAAAPFVAAIATAACSAAPGAAKRRLPFGAAVRAEQVYGNAAFAAAIDQHCQIIVPEIELNWDKVSPSEGDLNFYQADQLADFATRHGKKMTGHVLVWHLSIPNWAKPGLGQTGGWELVRRYFASVIPRYGTVTDHWDVVNEPLLMGHRQDGLRPSPYLDAFGPSYIARAFHEAHVFAPHAKLSLNEFGTTYDFKEEHDKRYFMLKMLESLKKSGAPIHGVGLQSHLELAKQGSFNPKVLAEFVKEIAGMGYEIRITELDVRESDYTAPADVRDMRVADAVRRYLDVVTASPALTEISCWGLSDAFSWLGVLPEDLAGKQWPAGQGPGLNRGLPFNSDMQPKPMWNVLDAALNV